MPTPNKHYHTKQNPLAQTTTQTHDERARTHTPKQSDVEVENLVADHLKELSRHTARVNARLANELIREGSARTDASTTGRTNR